MPEPSDPVRDFQRDGFAHVRGVLTPEEVARYAAAVDAAVARRKQYDTRAVSEKSPYEQSFIQCQYLWEDFPQVRALTFDQKVTGLAARLLQVPRLRLWHDQALYKEAGGRETEAHQDHPYWPIAELDQITAWIPLMDIAPEHGCMGYVPGTQHGDCEFIDIFTTPGAGKALEARYAKVNPPRYVPCKAGDVIFHHGHTVHMAKPNLSGETRRVYTAIYFRDGCTRGSTRPHPSVDRDGIKVGEVIRGAATPVAWPITDGKLPEPAPWPEVKGARFAKLREMGIIPSAIG